MYVGKGYVQTGSFFIGHDKEEASELFAQLTGNSITMNKAVLRLDFMATSEQGLDTVLGTLGCTLCEMSENIKVILKETFRMLNMA
jgi:hypothetical protein